MMTSMVRSILLVGMLFLNLAHADDNNAVASMELKGREILVQGAGKSKIQVFHDDNGNFSVMKDGVTHQVQSWDVEKEVRNLSNEQLNYFLGNIQDIEINGQIQSLVKISEEEFDKLELNPEPIAIQEISNEELSKITSQLSPGGYLVINERSDGSYSIQARYRLLGGGPTGAYVGAFMGKFIVHAVAQTIIVTIATGANMLAPGSGVIVYYALTETTAIAVEATSVAISLAGCITGAALTGPV